MSSGRWRHAHLDQSRSRQAGGWGYGRVDGTSSGRSRFRATKLIPPPALVYGHRGDETHLWVHRVYGLQFPENVGMDYVVVIEEKQMVSSCRRCATVSGYGLKRIALVAHVSDSRVIPKPACDAFSGIVRGTVVHHDDLKCRIACRQDACNAVANHRCAVEGWDDYRNAWRFCGWSCHVAL